MFRELDLEDWCQYHVRLEWLKKQPPWAVKFFAATFAEYEFDATDEIQPRNVFTMLSNALGGISDESLHKHFDYLASIQRPVHGYPSYDEWAPYHAADWDFEDTQAMVCQLTVLDKFNSIPNVEPTLKSIHKMFPWMLGEEILDYAIREADKMPIVCDLIAEFGDKNGVQKAREFLKVPATQ